MRISIVWSFFSLSRVVRWGCMGKTGRQGWLSESCVWRMRRFEKTRSTITDTGTGRTGNTEHNQCKQNPRGCFGDSDVRSAVKNSSCLRLGVIMQTIFFAQLCVSDPQLLSCSVLLSLFLTLIASSAHVQASTSYLLLGSRFRTHCSAAYRHTRWLALALQSIPFDSTAPIHSF